MTAWNPNIPNPANVPAADATAMQLNNAVLDAAFQVDHVNLALVTNQGFHKQISLRGAGAPPYSVSGTQNYEYAKLLASNVRSYLEYQPSGPDVFAGNPAVVPLSFKAYATFDTPALTFRRRFNIASVTFLSPQWTITFNENMPDAFYTTLFSFVQLGATELVVVSQSVSNVVIQASNPLGTSLVSVMVM